MTICRFAVQGSGSPDLPLRILNLFAQQDLAYESATIEKRRDRYLIAIEHSTLGIERATIIVERMRAMVLVHRADLTVVHDRQDVKPLPRRRSALSP